MPPVKVWLVFGRNVSLNGSRYTHQRCDIKVFHTHHIQMGTCSTNQLNYTLMLVGHHNHIYHKNPMVLFLSYVNNSGWVAENYMLCDLESRVMVRNQIGSHFPSKPIINDRESSSSTHPHHHHTFYTYSIQNTRASKNVNSVQNKHTRMDHGSHTRMDHGSKPHVEGVISHRENVQTCNR